MRASIGIVAPVRFLDALTRTRMEFCRTVGFNALERLKSGDFSTRGDPSVVPLDPLGLDPAHNRESDADRGGLSV
jgi:hypothetical protein